MRLLTNVRAASRETDDFAERLASIAKRGKVEVSSYPCADEAAQPHGVQRRFWTPEEVEETRGE